MAVQVSKQNTSMSKSKVLKTNSFSYSAPNGLEDSDFQISELLEKEYFDCYPFGFGGWNIGRYHQLVMASGQMTEEFQEKMAKNQCQVYLGWVNAQLKKRSQPRLISNLKADIDDGTVFSDLIEVIAGEKLEIIAVPSSHGEKVANINKVLRFMKAKRIPMHPINAEDIISGDVRSVMRLILALAARYKPNTVKQTGRHGEREVPGSRSVVSYAQSAVTALADARRNASIVIPKPKKPKSLEARDDAVGFDPKDSSNSTNSPNVCHPAARSPSISSKSSQSIPKSSSQDFTVYSGQRKDSSLVSENDSKYQELLSAYCQLDSEHKVLKQHNNQLQSVCHDLHTDTMILRKMLLSLKQLLDVEEENVDPEMSSFSDESEETSADIIHLKNRLSVSEEICCDIKEDLSRTRSECLRLQGAEVGLQQRLRQQQKLQFDLKAEMNRMKNEIQILLNDKRELEKELSQKNQHIADLQLTPTSKGALEDRKSKDEIYSSDGKGGQDDFRIVHESLGVLRNYFGSENPCHETMKRLDDGFKTLINRLTLYEEHVTNRQTLEAMKLGNQSHRKS